MPCEFCDPNDNCGFCIPLGKGSVSFSMDYENFGRPTLCLTLEIPSAQKIYNTGYFDVEVCPVCGRKLVRDE